MSALKVAHITTVDLSLRYLLLNQLRSLRDAGYVVTGISASGPEVAAVEAAGIRHLAAPLTRSYTPAADAVALWRLYRLLRRERFTIVHTHTPKAGLLGQYAAVLARVPVRIHTIHGLYLPEQASPAMRRFYVAVERATMRFSHLNLSQNPEDIAVAVAERISDAGRLRLLGNGIDMTAFDPVGPPGERRRATRAELGLSDEHKVVGMVARFVAEKGYRELIEAARIIKRQLPAARFVLVGPLEMAKADGLDPRLIADAGVEDIVQFLGHRTDLPDLYAAMDLLALPSYREGFPRVPMEATAMGIPAVVTDIRGCRQTVEHGVTGLLVPVRDAQALAAAILDLLQDDARRLTYGRAARLKALREFDERVVFARVKEAYRDLLAERLVAMPTCTGELG